MSSMYYNDYNQLGCQNIITDDEELLNEIFKVLEKLICHIYGPRFKKSDYDFEKKIS